MFCIAICDDELMDREKIQELTQDICESENIPAEVNVFERTQELLKTLGEGRQYDLMLLDVMMPEQDGMEMARQLRCREDRTDIVFISNNREMALHGYEVCAQRYLAKPVEEGRLREAILFCYKKFQSSRRYLLPSGGSMRKADPKEIYYIEIVGRKCRLAQENETWMTSLSIGKLEEMFGCYGFVRCHQSFLVNCAYIRVFHSSSVELLDGESIPVSKHRLKETRQAFFEYMQG